MNPTPPPGMRILTAEELTKPLPMDAMWWSELDQQWEPSACRGRLAFDSFHYATATPPPTDWRKLVEELVRAIEDDAASEAILADLGVSEWESFITAQTRPVFTRAKSALEVKL